MSIKFRLDNKWYEDFKLYRRVNIELEPGITMLVGCNGIGKTTFINQLVEHCRKNKIECVDYSDIKSGRGNAIREAVYNHDYRSAGVNYNSSEGECVKYNFENQLIKIGEYIRKHGLIKSGKSLVITMDGIDSGVSIDNAEDIISTLKFIIDTNKETFGIETYIICSTNQYEFTKNMRNLSVYHGSYKEFKDYEDYRKFILKTKEVVMKRYKDNESKGEE